VQWLRLVLAELCGLTRHRLATASAMSVGPVQRWFGILMLLHESAADGRGAVTGPPVLTEDSSPPGIPPARRSTGTHASCARSCSLTWPVHRCASECASELQNVRHCKPFVKDNNALQLPTAASALVLLLVSVPHQGLESGAGRAWRWVMLMTT
jgi:hypothetical protein